MSDYSFHVDHKMLYKMTAYACYDRTFTWHRKCFPDENLDTNEIYSKLKNLDNWSDLISESIAKNIEVTAPNKKVYTLTWLPIEHFAIRYYLTWFFSQYIDGLWHNRINSMTTSSFSQRSLFLKGNKSNIKLHQHWLEQRQSNYVLKFDIQSFYASIDHAYLISKIEKELSQTDCSNGQIEGSLKLLKNLLRFPYHEKSSKNIEFKEMGLPIGNTTERFFSNVYLSELDFLLVLTPGISFSRRLDDVYIFSDEKKQLEEVLNRLEILLISMKLKTNKNKTKIVERSK